LKNFLIKKERKKMDSSFSSATISTTSRNLLRKGGFINPLDVLKIQPSTLASELDITPSQALKLIEEIRTCSDLQQQKNGKSTTSTALDLLLAERNKIGNQHIVTHCRELDGMLQGGIPIGTLTELCGPPGAGKTQFCMQVCVSVTIPIEMGGIGGGALYLDTEGSFSPYRVMDMAEAQYQLLKKTISKRNITLSSPLPSKEDIATRIRYCRARDLTEQMAFIRCLSDILEKHPDIKLVIVDSVAFHFRHDFQDLSMRAKLLSRLAQTLNSCAAQYNVAIVVTNHITTRIGNNTTTNSTKQNSYENITTTGSNDGGNISSNTIDNNNMFIPALGDTWSHGVANRILLTALDETIVWTSKVTISNPVAHIGENIDTSTVQQQQQLLLLPNQLLRPNAALKLRTARILKSSYLAPKTVKFIVTPTGIRDPPTSTTTTSTTTTTTSTLVSPPTTITSTTTSTTPITTHLTCANLIPNNNNNISSNNDIPMNISTTTEIQNEKITHNNNNIEEKNNGIIKKIRIIE
jgi:RAD51-like protein 2